MKIVYYCQHVLGMGHYFRSLEICKALRNQEVILVSGGAPLNMRVPAHIREVSLPPLTMDSNFSRLESNTGSIENIKAARQQEIYELFANECPDIFMVELYPFGRKAFGFELIPVFQAIREGLLCPSRVVCSLRDVLVEKKEVEAYESRVISALNQWFDALLIHSDAEIVKLDETFSRVTDIRIPVVYTGFVTPRPLQGDRNAVRQQLDIDNDARLVVASAGGGKVGFELLDAVIRAFAEISVADNLYLQVFTGPFMEDGAVKHLQEMRTDRISVLRFTSDFPAYLAAADLSVSMAGYNTTMNIVAAGVPSLVWPFSQNREQRLRAERISEMGRMRILENADLLPKKLAELMTESLIDPNRCDYPIDLNGAEHTADWIQSSMETQRKA
jgi:predicted glycosyltransferase